MNRESSWYNSTMKSKKIKVHNLSGKKDPASEAIYAKPIGVLNGMMIAGAILLFVRSEFLLLGISLLVFSAFCRFCMPDRILARFHPEYVELYNQMDRSMCMLVYWADVVSWTYVKGKTDEWILHLVDGSSQSLDMYSYKKIKELMNRYAPLKELKR